MNDLTDLLKHEIQDLYSVEEQIIKALPEMIEKASNKILKKTLSEHLQITEQQKDRLTKIQQMMNGGGKEINDEEKKEGLLARLFKHKQVCKGMEGIIEEGNKIISEDMSLEVLDAAIIASAQKIEHYEICGYGTARTYANELNLKQVANLLEQTLNEEYEADDRLTELAISRVNEKAGIANKSRSGAGLARTKIKEAGREKLMQKNRSLEPVAMGRGDGAEEKKGRTSERGGKPKATSLPRGAASGREAASAKRLVTNKTKAKPGNKSSSHNNVSSGARGGSSKKALR